ncbi:CotH kinase family protein [Rummeliibacillus pycnus]|uniref:CotH kinase family protein n=1 Tax=Rummeliibacillus pycnus TaxID=101070 RepID=UPI000C9D0233|nr:CotH kinase family protein [Rummeliibacillus pycnus]
MSKSIPSYYLMIEEDDLDTLRENLLYEDTVPAKLRVGKTTHQIEIGYRGSYTRKFRKRSYTIHFDENDYLFGAHKIHLNAEYRDPSLIRNKLSLDFFQDLGVLSPNSQHINFYRNGVLKGVYLQLESVDEMFLKKRNLPTGPIYYAENNDANFSLTRDDKPKKSRLSGYYQACGTPDDDERLRELITIINKTPSSAFPQKIEKYIDIEKFFCWLVGAVCTMNNDGFTHNYSLYRNSETGLFEIMPWDYDATWGRKVSGGIMDHTYVPIGGKPDNKLCYLLLEVPEFRKMYREKLEETLETKFTIEYMKDKVLSLHELIRPHLILDPYKKNKIELFDQEPEIIFQFIKMRNHFLINQLKLLV